jgi:hypothetical protein
VPRLGEPDRAGAIAMAFPSRVALTEKAWSTMISPPALNASRGGSGRGGATRTRSSSAEGRIIVERALGADALCSTGGGEPFGNDRSRRRLDNDRFGAAVGEIHALREAGRAGDEARSDNGRHT